jgi:hypothetical protein
MTNKKNYTHQIGTNEARSRILRKHRPAVVRATAAKQASRLPNKKRKRSSVDRKSRTALPFEADEPLPYTNPSNHFHISTSIKYPVHIGTFERENKGDPALEVSCAGCDLLPAHVLRRTSALTSCITLRHASRASLRQT